jgi:cytidylate kinase
VVALRVAERLGWRLHNRAIPVEVASRLSVPLEAALEHDEASQNRIGRILAKFSVQLVSESAASIPAEVFMQEDAFREHSESVIQDLANGSSCVIVGRAAAIVIGDVSTALHVRLDGKHDRRVRQGANALNISREEATRRLIETDRARALYVKHFYGVDWADAGLYHVVLDSTALTLAACVEIVIAAATDRFGTMGLTA